MIPVDKRQEDNSVIDWSEKKITISKQNSDAESCNVPWRQIQLSLPSFEDTLPQVWEFEQHKMTEILQEISCIHNQWTTHYNS